MRAPGKYFLGVLIACALLASTAAPASVEPDLKQQTLNYCNDRARVAHDIAIKMLQGATTEQVTLTWPTPPATEDIEIARELWVQVLKKEVNDAAVTVPRDKEDWAARVAQKVIEKCWYDYGKHFGDKQSATPPPLGFMRTASSQDLTDLPAVGKTAEPDLVDRINALSSESYCDFVANLFQAGIIARNRNSPLVFIDEPRASATETCAEGIARPNDGIFICGLNAESWRSRELIFEHISQGWHYAEAQEGGKANPEDAGGYYQACMKSKEISPPREGSMKDTAFIKVISPEASDEEIETFRIKTDACRSRRLKAGRIYQLAHSGLSKNAFWKQYPLPESYSAADRKEAQALLDAAFDAKSGEVFMRQVHEACVAAAQP